jgi:cytoskeletal protein RodZ
MAHLQRKGNIEKTNLPISMKHLYNNDKQNYTDTELVDMGWSQMSSLLDKHMPTESKRKVIPWYTWSAAAVVVVTLSSVWYQYTLSNTQRATYTQNTLHHTVPSEQPATSSTQNNSVAVAPTATTIASYTPIGVAQYTQNQFLTYAPTTPNTTNPITNVLTSTSLTTIIPSTTSHQQQPATTSPNTPTLLAALTYIPTQQPTIEQPNTNYTPTRQAHHIQNPKIPTSYQVKLGALTNFSSDIGVNASAIANFPINEKWSLQTGAQYAILYPNATAGGLQIYDKTTETNNLSADVSYERHTIQQLHYASIPIQVAFTPNRKFAVQAGFNVMALVSESTKNLYVNRLPDQTSLLQKLDAGIEIAAQYFPSKNVGFEVGYNIGTSNILKPSTQNSQYNRYAHLGIVTRFL